MERPHQVGSVRDIRSRPRGRSAGQPLSIFQQRHDDPPGPGRPERRRRPQEGLRRMGLSERLGGGMQVPGGAQADLPQRLLLHGLGGRRDVRPDHGAHVDHGAIRSDYPNDWAVECKCLEAPKLIFHNGYYYMASAEGGTSGPTTAHMSIMARSDLIIRTTGRWNASAWRRPS